MTAQEERDHLLRIATVNLFEKMFMALAVIYKEQKKMSAMEGYYLVFPISEHIMEILNRIQAGHEMRKEDAESILKFLNNAT